MADENSNSNQAGNWLAAGQAVGSMFGGVLQSKSQYKLNMKAAKWQYKKNLEMMQLQNQYNSPKSQMGRYLEAGLNPNLIYGSGSANAGNMERPPQAPQIQPQQAVNLGMALSEYQQARLMQAQTDLTNVKVDESTVKQDLAKAQTAVAKANPYLNKSYVEAMVTQLQGAANVKEAEGWVAKSLVDRGDGTAAIPGLVKVEKEIQLLSQRFNLGSADQKIKAEVLTSKEFQNALQEIQLEWMKNAEVTPEHIRLGIMLLLQKFK